MPRYEFWRETETEDVWAVELVGDVVVRCAGPLHWAEITPSFLPRGYDLRAADAPDLEARRDEFEPLSEFDIVTMIASSD